MSNQESSSQQQLNESLSALMDGEASEMEVRRILKSDNQEIDERWARYHLARDAMRGEVELPVHMDFSASISAAIADEPAHSLKASNARSKKSLFWPNLGRFAVAASVAGAVVVGVQFAPNTPSGNIANVNQPVSAPSNLPNTPVLTPSTSVRTVGNEERKKPIVINEATQEQLQQMESEVNRLMLEHAQNATQNTQQGVLPYVRVPEAEQ